MRQCVGLLMDGVSYVLFSAINDVGVYVDEQGRYFIPTGKQFLGRWEMKQIGVEHVITVRNFSYEPNLQEVK